MRILAYLSGRWQATSAEAKRSGHCSLIKIKTPHDRSAASPWATHISHVTQTPGRIYSVMWESKRPLWAVDSTPKGTEDKCRVCWTLGTRLSAVQSEEGSRSEAAAAHFSNHQKPRNLLSGMGGGLSWFTTNHGFCVAVCGWTMNCLFFFGCSKQLAWPSPLFIQRV